MSRRAVAMPPPPPPAPPQPLPSEPQTTSTVAATVHFERCTQSREDTLREIGHNLENVLEKWESVDKDMLCAISSVQAILQHGPVCGLVALGMAAEAYAQKEVDMDAMFQNAKEQGMTKNGEMFSAIKMTTLAAQEIGPCVNNSAFTPELVNTENADTFYKIMDCLLSNDLILMPYDADHNHAPTKRNGNAAHWTIVIGFAVIVKPIDLENGCCPITIEQFFPITPDGGRIRFLETDKKLGTEEKSNFVTYLTELPKSHIYLCCRQGKSKHVGIWQFANLMASNQNLKNAGTKILEKAEEYVLEPIDVTLRSQAILLWRNQT